MPIFSFVVVPHKLSRGSSYYFARLGNMLACMSDVLSLLAALILIVPWLAVSPPFNYAYEKNLSSVVNNQLGIHLLLPHLLFYFHLVCRIRC